MDAVQALRACGDHDNISHPELYINGDHEYGRAGTGGTAANTAPMIEVVNNSSAAAAGVPLASPGSSSSGRTVQAIEPGSFEPSHHFYPRVLNAQIHPLVRSFLGLGNHRIAKRYCHLHPEADADAVSAVLRRSTRFFRWGGADLFSTTSSRGQKKLVVVETNSCPSGQKSMPLANEDMEHAGYQTLLEKSFVPLLDQYPQLPEGGLAVLYDKNKMEAWGYAATLADLTNETVFLVPCYADDFSPKFRFREDGVLEVRVPASSKAGCVESNGECSRVNGHNSNIACPNKGLRSENGINHARQDCPVHRQCQREGYGLTLEPQQADHQPTTIFHNHVWMPIRAALRYVTQRPWSRMPPISRTLIYNPVLACLAGGRNKMLAAKAYDLFNAEIASTGLMIYTPETIWDVTKPEVPLWVRRMGGLAVVKVPYANAGQGVWTITHDGELQAFMQVEHRYDRFIVQALIGNNGWSSLSQHGRLYHVGTIPNIKSNIYAADLRMMIGSSPEGFFPVAIYGRRARLPLAETIDKGAQSWDMLGTNLSVKNSDGTWQTETERLLLMDSRDFNCTGIGVDDLIEAYMQTVLAMLAIDGLACNLITPKGSFGMKLFQALNPDPKLLAEMYPTQLKPPIELMVPRASHKEVSIESNGNRRQSSILEDVLAVQLEEKVVMATSMVPTVCPTL